MSQFGLLKIDDLAAMALAAAVLAHHAADPPLGCPVTLLQDRDGPAPALRAQKFPVAPQGAPHGATRSLSIALSSSASARSLLSRAFSFSSWLSRWPLLPSCRHTADDSGGRWAETCPELGRRLRRSGPGQSAGQPFTASQKRSARACG
jgi:hypothetical protein